MRLNWRVVGVIKPKGNQLFGEKESTHSVIDAVETEGRILISPGFARGGKR